jgi:hypothetical protein
VEGLAGGAEAVEVEVEAVEVEVVLACVVWNGFHQVGDQVLPVWQPVIATTDNRANAPRAIELRIFVFL